MLGEKGAGSVLVNQVDPSMSHGQRYKMTSAIPAIATTKTISFFLQHSQGNDRPELFLSYKKGKREGEQHVILRKFRYTI